MPDGTGGQGRTGETGPTGGTGRMRGAGNHGSVPQS